MRRSLAVVLSSLAIGVSSVVAACGHTSQIDPTPQPETDASLGTDAPADAPPGPGSINGKPSGCFVALEGSTIGPDYDQFNPKMGPHCYGTQQQKIEGVQRVVFLGDSITTGTPPTPTSKFYRSLVGAGLQQRFGQIDVQDCSKWGASSEDLMGGFDAGGDAAGGGDNDQIRECFPTGVEQRKTLIIFTMGGNDLAAWSKSKPSAEEGIRLADQAATAIGDGVRWLKDPAHFPNGSYVIFTNVYEFTDTTGDLDSCPAAGVAGFSGVWLQAGIVLKHLQEQLMKQAAETGTDMLFLQESFCGHGFHYKDEKNQCYRGPDSQLWFDLSCIHPNPTGHAKIAEMFLTVVDGHLPQ